MRFANRAANIVLGNAAIRCSSFWYFKVSLSIWESHLRVLRTALKAWKVCNHKACSSMEVNCVFVELYGSNSAIRMWSLDSFDFENDLEDDHLRIFIIWSSYCTFQTIQTFSGCSFELFRISSGSFCFHFAYSDSYGLKS